MQATASASEAKNFVTQPEACRTAGTGITKYLAENKATMDPATQRTTYVAAAASYDFAGAGFELRGGKLGAEHCAMVEATYNAVLGDEPSNPVLAAKVSVVDAVVTECRKTFTCSTNADGDMVCTAK